MATFVCQVCKKDFSVLEKTLAKFPNWQPKVCFSCKKKDSPTSGFSREENLSLQEVLEKYVAGPVDGVFADGAAEPNPGPGGWGVVYVVNNQIVARDCGQEPHTTNNRMELTALLEACRLIPLKTPATIYTDSQLCVNTFTLWAKNWAAKGWRRKAGGKGEIKNLELVQQVYGVLQQRPEIQLKWIKAHSGNRWNEYADALATAYRRKELVPKQGEKFDLPTAS